MINLLIIYCVRVIEGGNVFASFLNWITVAVMVIKVIINDLNYDELK